MGMDVTNMLSELYAKLDCVFNDRDRDKCIQTINRIVELANIARQKGVLLLETEMEHENSLFLQTALALIIDGRDPDSVKQVLINLILAGRYSGAELLGRLIMADGVLAIQQGENPRFIGIKLFSMLGEKYISSADEAFLSIRKNTARLSQFLATQKGKRPLLDSALFEELFAHLDDRVVQAVVYGFDETVLFNAIYGCGYTVVSKVLTNISVNIAMGVIDEWEKLEHVHNAVIIRCQDEIMEKLYALEEAGEIVIPRRPE